MGNYYKWDDSQQQQQQQQQQGYQTASQQQQQQQQSLQPYQNHAQEEGHQYAATAAYDAGYYDENDANNVIDRQYDRRPTVVDRQEQSSNFATRLMRGARSLADFVSTGK